MMASLKDSAEDQITMIKKIILILMFFPIIAFAGEIKESENVKKFRYMCEHSDDASMRELYCSLWDQQEKAEAIANDFTKSDAAVSHG